jgi:phospholipid transport system substrate-binding protein
MKNVKNSLLLSLLIVFMSTMLASLPSFASSDPVRELDSIANRLITKLKAKQATLKSDPGYVYSAAYQVVVPFAAVDEMTKRVLPPQILNKATAAQRSRFQKQFISILVHTYASALADYNDQTIHFFPVRGGYQGRSTIQVSSNIERADGPAISVNYRLVARGSSWKLYDMSVEGVSMLESFRSQFADALSRGDIDSLIQALQAHNGQ